MHPRPGWFVICHKLPIIILLIALAGLATIAKDGQYYHRSSPSHQAFLSTKMNDTQAPVVVLSSPSQRMVGAIPAKPAPDYRTRIDSTPPLVQPVGLLLCFRHRSPPVVVSL